MARLLNYVKGIFEMPMSDVHAWTDSTIVLSWLSGSPKRFKTFVGNRVATTIELIPPERWRHVVGTENPAECASRGLTSCVVCTTQYSSFERLRRVIAWIMRFVNNCRPQKFEHHSSSYLSMPELILAETHLYFAVQIHHFPTEINLIKYNQCLPKGSCLLPLSPFIDSSDSLRVGGRQGHANLPYSRMHPIILHGNHPIMKLLILFKHKRLLHAGATLVISSIVRHFLIIRIRQTVRSITCQCIICRCQTIKPHTQMLGQLPLERLTPGSIFEKIGLDYAGPILVKYGHVRKPVILKAFVCVFVSLAVKTVHLELVSDLTSDALIACLRRFVSRRGYLSLLWSDHGTNFVGAKNEFQEFI